MHFLPVAKHSAAGRVAVATCGAVAHTLKRRVVIRDIDSMHVIHLVDPKSAVTALVWSADTRLAILEADGLLIVDAAEEDS